MPEQETQFPDTPQGWQQRWTTEFAAAKKALEKWHHAGEKLVDRFRDERDGSEGVRARWNLFTSNIQTLEAMLFGQLPSVSVTRRFADARDDVARVGAELLERLLNTDIEREGDSQAVALKNALSDRLLPGLGNVRLRYVAEFETQTTPAKTAVGPDGQPVELAPEVVQDVKTSEDVEIDYVYWKDQLWDAGARTFSEVRWWAFRALMSRESLKQRFGEKLGQAIPLNAKKAKSDADAQSDAAKATPWDRAEIWEVWDKESRQVFWLCADYPAILDRKKDPLGLERFWPFPRPLFANLTTSTLVPVSDFRLAQDLYDEIDDVSTRIVLLEQAIRVAGVYDAQCTGLERLLSEEGTANNVLIPVANWAVFQEKGGLAGAVSWLPVDQVVAALDKLREYRTELVGALYQANGMSDIMRGQAVSGGVTATEQAIKARFGSVRVQALQDEFARFCGETQSIKAEIIAKHFSPETIVERSNAMLTMDDPQLVADAVQFIQSKVSYCRIEVKPESISLTDFAALKQERMEVLSGMTSFLQAAAPLMQSQPAAIPYLLQMLQWTVSGLRGAGEIEGVLDQMISHAQQAQQQQAIQGQAPKPPDPKLMAQAQKAQQDAQKTQLDLQADLVRINAETQANDQRQADQTKWNIREQQMRDQLKQQAQAREAMGPPPVFAPPGLGGGL